MPCCSPRGHEELYMTGRLNKNNYTYKIFYGIIVDLQYCVSFKCTGKWSSYTYTYICSFLDSLYVHIMWYRYIWDVYIMRYYSAIKKNEIMTFTATWVDLENIILSEVSQIKTNIIWYHLYVESKKWYKWTYL